MDQEPEDWEEKKRIKAEISKAEMASNEEDKSNLAKLGAEAFVPRKGFSRETEEFRRSGERFAWNSVSLAVLGIVGVIWAKVISMTEMGSVVGIIETITIIVIALAVLFGIAGITAAIVYYNKTGKSVKHILISSVTAIVVAIFCLAIRFNLLNL